MTGGCGHSTTSAPSPIAWVGPQTTETWFQPVGYPMPGVEVAGLPGVIPGLSQIHDDPADDETGRVEPLGERPVQRCDDSAVLPGVGVLIRTVGTEDQRAAGPKVGIPNDAKSSPGRNLIGRIRHDTDQEHEEGADDPHPYYL